MDNSFEHKGFVGRFHREEGDAAYHGRVVGLRDVVHFQGESPDELQQSFRDSVDDYLLWLETEGVEPKQA